MGAGHAVVEKGKGEEAGMSGLAYFTARKLMPGFGDRI
jgi:hypothetical protein